MSPGEPGGSPAASLVARAAAESAAFAVPVTNAAEVRLHLHRVPVSRVELRSERATVTAEARLRGILRPGESRTCRLRLDLPPGTPPGEYEGELSVLGEPTKLRVVVAPAHDVEVRPRRLVCEVARDGHHLVALSLANRGNVPVTVHHPITVRAEPRDRSCRVLRSALARSTSTEPPGPIFDALLRAAADSTDSDPILAAQIEGAPFELAPGEARLVRMTLRISIAERGVYRALLDVAGTRVRVDIHARHGKGGEE